MWRVSVHHILRHVVFRSEQIFVFIPFHAHCFAILGLLRYFCESEVDYENAFRASITAILFFWMPEHKVARLDISMDNASLKIGPNNI